MKKIKLSYATQLKVLEFFGRLSSEPVEEAPNTVETLAKHSRALDDYLLVVVEEINKLTDEQIMEALRFYDIKLDENFEEIPKPARRSTP